MRCSRCQCLAGDRRQTWRALEISPGFYKNEDLAECSIWARFIFLDCGCWPTGKVALRIAPKRIKGRAASIRFARRRAAFERAESAGFIERYEVDGRAFIQIVAFSKHQNPHHREPESNIPAPQSPRLSTDGTHKSPRFYRHAMSQKPRQARGKPRIVTPKHDLEGVNPADSLILIL